MTEQTIRIWKQRFAYATLIAIICALGGLFSFFWSWSGEVSARELQVEKDKHLLLVRKEAAELVQSFLLTKGKDFEELHRDSRRMRDEIRAFNNQTTKESGSAAAKSTAALESVRRTERDLEKFRKLVTDYENVGERALKDPKLLRELKESLTKQLGPLVAVNASPIGAVVAYAGELVELKRPPAAGLPPVMGLKKRPDALEGTWLLCNGAELATDDYKPAWSALGQGRLYGAGQPQGDNTTFKLPDFRGCFLRGLDSTGTVDKDRGRKLGERQSDALQNHVHLLFGNQIKGDGRGTTVSGYHLGSGKMTFRQMEDKARFSSAGVAVKRSAKHVSPSWIPESKVADETRPVNYAVHWIIRVK